MERECNRRRALGKASVVLAAIAAAVAGLSQLITTDTIDVLKHSLSLWSIVALVVIINLVSFSCFIVLFFAYRWIRCDLKPPRDAAGRD